MKLSLIIPTYNRPKDIMRLLRNLNLQDKKPDEVILVDASDTDETKLIVGRSKGRFAFPVSYYSHEKGLTRQRNFGIGKAQYEIIGFSDDDSLFEPDYFLRILDIFEKDTGKEIGGAAGFIIQVEHSKILAIDERLDSIGGKEDFTSLMKAYIYSARTIPRSKAREKIEKLLLMHSEEEGTYCPEKGCFVFPRTLFRGQKVVDFLPGIAFYRKEVFNYTKYSDFFQGYGFAEDVHFSLQVGKRYKLVLDGEALVYHMHSPLGRPDLFRVGYMLARNHYYIFKTYKKRSMTGKATFWYFFCLNALLDVMPAFVGKNSLARIKVFSGQIYGGLRAFF